MAWDCQVAEMHQEAKQFDGDSDSSRPMLHTGFYLVVWGQDKHLLRTIRASVTFLPLDKCILLVLLTEVSQFVNRGHTKVDNDGVGAGSRWHRGC